MKSSYYKKIFESYLNESPESLNRVDHWEKYGANSIKIFYKDGKLTWKKESWENDHTYCSC